MVKIIDGAAIAATIRSALADDVAQYRKRNGDAPGLAVVLVGSDPASRVYVKSKIEQARKIGMRSIEHRLPEDTRETALLSLITEMNLDTSVHGILVQLPLPKHIRPEMVLDAIDPAKDVDGFHPVNVGRLSTGTSGLVPCTPLGCMILLDHLVDDYKGLNAVVIGSSNIVGKPVALLLLERGCTVTITHILTRDLPSIVKTADIVVAAAGSAGLVRGDWVKAGAVVIDVGINRITDADGLSRIVGDVDTGSMAHARAVTPVPGGVGPMTVACLLSNTMKAARAADIGARPINGWQAITSTPERRLEPS